MDREIKSKQWIGNRMKTLRIEKGMSQETLGYSLGISQGMVSHLEQGNFILSANHLQKAAKVFGISIGEFFEELPTEMSFLEKIIPLNELHKEFPGLSVDWLIRLGTYKALTSIAGIMEKGQLEFYADTEL